MPPRLRSRAALRAHLMRQLPGWEFWLDYTARLVRGAAHDREILLSSGQILASLNSFLDEWVTALGEDAERMFRPFMRRFPGVLSPDVDYAAAGERSLTTPGGSWDQLERVFDRRRAWPSPLLMQLLGAYALSSRETRRGPKGDPRRDLAVKEVAAHLGPFVAGQSRAGTPVIPAVYQDPRFGRGGARLPPIPIELAAEVVVFLSAPGAEDVEYDGEPGAPRRSSDTLFAAPTAIVQITKLLRTCLAIPRK